MGLLGKIKGWRARRERDRIKKHYKEIKKLEVKKVSLKARIKKKQKVEGRSKAVKELRNEVKGLEKQLSSRTKLLGDAERKFGTAVSKQLGKAKKSIKKELKMMIDDIKRPPSKRRGRRRR